MDLPLHRTDDRPDWDYTEPADYNKWQTLAVKSNGLLTPANFISILGALFTIYGLILITGYKGYFWQGIGLIILGRIGDLLDGVVAQATGTKSPLGEAIDASLDKMVMLVALLALLFGNLLPAVVGAAMIAQNTWNAIISLKAKAKKLPLHPNLYGKISVFLSWALLVLYPIHAVLDNKRGILDNMTLVAATLVFLGYIILGAVSSYKYYKDLRTLSLKAGK